jgi:hypothetical protein
MTDTSKATPRPWHRLVERVATEYVRGRAWDTPSAASLSSNIYTNLQDALNEVLELTVGARMTHKTSQATLHVAFRRFEEGTILYIEGTDESMSIKDWELAQQIVDAVNSHNPERDKLARELAEIVLEEAGGYGVINTGHHQGKAIITKARQLLKLYEEEK